MTEQDEEFEKFTAELKAKARALGFISVNVGVPAFDEVLGSVIEWRHDLFDHKKLTVEQIVEFVDLFRPDLLEFLSEELELPKGNEFDFHKDGHTYWSFYKKNVYPSVSSGVITYEHDFGVLKAGLISVGSMQGRYSGTLYAPHTLGGVAAPSKQLTALEKWVSTRFGPLYQSKDLLRENWKATNLK